MCYNKFGVYVEDVIQAAPITSDEYTEMPLRLSAVQVNDYVLHRQHLTPASRGKSVLAVVRDIGPLRASPTITPYISLWSRMENFERQQLESALYQERTLVRVPCMKARLYIVPSADYPAYYQATKPFLQQGLKELDSLLSDVDPEGSAPLHSEELAQRVLEIMSVWGTCTAAKLAELLPALNTQLLHDPEQPEQGHTTLGARLLPAMCAQGMLVRAQPRGSWRSDHYSYATLSSWLPTLDLNSVTEREALRQVILSYIAAFGPVTVGDILHWLGSIARRQVVATLMELSNQLARLQISGSQGDYFMLKDQVPELLDYERPGERIVGLLPPRDSYLTAYSDTSRFLEESYREHVFDRAGESFGTVWVDGYVVGIWWPQIKEERIVVRFFEPMDPEALALIAEESFRLGKFLEFSSIDLQMGSYFEGDIDAEGFPAPLLQTNPR